MKKKLTMQDIADMTGVTKSTISRYFNGGYVKDETRKKIKAVIDKYHYEPNTFAQSLKAKNSRMIGVIAPCLDSTVTSRTMMAIDEYLRKEGYTSLFINTDHSEQLELKHMEGLWRMNADGLILIATQVTQAHHELVQKMDIPVVFVGQKYEQGISIINDDFVAAEQAGAYIAKHHREDIVYLGVEEKDHAVGVERRDGICSGCHKNGIAHVEILTTDFSFDHAYQMINELLHDRIPDAIICATDRLAFGAYKAIQEHHLHIPDDISVMGFGGYEMSTLLTPKLTTVRFESDVAGYVAAETMVKLIDQEPVPKVQIIGFEFLEGESVKS